MRQGMKLCGKKIGIPVLACLVMCMCALWVGSMTVAAAETATLEVAGSIDAKYAKKNGKFHGMSWSISGTDKKGYELVLKGKCTDNDFKWRTTTSPYEYTAPWKDYVSKITSAKVSVTGLKNMSRMFFGYDSLKSINFKGTNTSKVTDMSLMFYNCQSLTKLDLSKFNTSKVTDMYCMFYGCTSLTKLDLSKFNTSKVTDMESMFYNCQSLTKLDLSKFNTSKVKWMRFMFYNCQSLTKLDLSKFNTSKVISMQNMFKDCKKLKKIYVGKGWKTSKKAVGMFQNCPAKIVKK